MMRPLTNKNAILLSICIVVAVGIMLFGFTILILQSQTLTRENQDSIQDVLERIPSSGPTTR